MVFIPPKIEVVVDDLVAEEPVDMDDFEDDEEMEDDEGDEEDDDYEEDSFVVGDEEEDDDDPDYVPHKKVKTHEDEEEESSDDSSEDDDMVPLAEHEALKIELRETRKLVKAHEREYKKLCDFLAALQASHPHLPEFQ